MIANEEKKALSILPFTSLSLMLVGPLLYEYAFQFFNANHVAIFEEKKKYIPFALFCILLLSAFLLLGQQVYTYVVLVAMAFSFLYLVFYLVVLVSYQIKSSGKLKYFYATIADKNLHWINILIIGLILVAVLDLISGVFIASLGILWIPILNTTALLVLIWYFGFVGLGQQQIVNNVHEFEIPADSEKKDNLCATQEYVDLKNKLNSLFEEKELYKNETLNLSLLAQHLETTEKKTSYLLNQCMHTNFYELINTFRTEAFKTKVKNGELKEKTILALALESGFNSKASFNRIFKQKNGVSPSAYAKNVKNASK